MSNPLASAPLINKYGEIVSSNVLDGKVVALYFSAYWCPPCRSFVPLLCRFYETLKANGENIEVVVVPGDDREDDFKNYFYRDHGDWLAVVPGSRECAQLNSLYLHVIPTLFVLGCNGNVVISDAKSDVARAESERNIIATFANWKKQAGVWCNSTGAAASIRRRLPDPFFGDPLHMQRSPSGRLGTGQAASIISNLTDAIPRTKVLPRRLPEYPSALPGSPHLPYSTAISPHGSRTPSCERTAYFGLQDPNLIHAVSFPSSIRLPSASYVLAPPLLSSPYEAPPVPPVPPVLRDRLDALEQTVSFQQWQHQHREKQLHQPRVDINAYNDEHRRLEGLERQYENILLENQALQKKVESIKLNQQCESPQNGKTSNGKASNADHNELHLGLLRERDQLQSRHEEILRENTRLQNEVESMRLKQQGESPQTGKAHHNELNLALLRERDQLQSRHEDVLRDNSRLQADFQKLQQDHSAEQRARSSISRKHEDVNKDARQLTDDLQKLQQAHQAELHSTKGDYQEKHVQAEEAAASVWRDFQQMQADRDAEQRARKEAEDKSQAMFQDAVRLRADFERVEAALRAEQQAREELQLKHHDLDKDHKQMRENLLDWQGRHGERETAEQRLIKSLEKEQEANATLSGKLEDLTEDLSGAHAEIESLAAKLRIETSKVRHLDMEIAAVRANAGVSGQDETKRLNDVERERDRALKDVELLRKANLERELEVKALRASPRLSAPGAKASVHFRADSRRSSTASEVYQPDRRRSSDESLQYEIHQTGNWGSLALPDVPPTDLGDGFMQGTKVVVNIGDSSSAEESDAPQMMVDLTGSDEDTAQVIGMGSRAAR